MAIQNDRIGQNNIEVDCLALSTWLMSWTCPVILCMGLLLLLGSQRNIVKSSDPEASLSGAPPVASVYLQYKYATSKDTIF